MAAGPQCQSCSSSHSASMGLFHAVVVHRALPSVEQDTCMWHTPSSSGKGARKRLHFPNHLPAFSIPPSGRARWAVLCAHGKRDGSQKMQTCSLPFLSPLCVLASDREAPFQYWGRVRKLAELNWVPGPAPSFHLSLYCKQLQSALVRWFTACSPVLVLAQLSSHLHTVQLCMNAGVIRKLYLSWERAESQAYP